MPEPGDKPNNLEPAQIPAIPIVMIGTGTGDGGAPITKGTIATTPDHQANFVVSGVISPLFAISIRFANAYVTALLGLVTAGLASNAIPYHDFKDLVMKCVGLSLAGPCVALGKDLITILSGLEKKFPLLTGNV